MLRFITIGNEVLLRSGRIVSIVRSIFWNRSSIIFRLSKVGSMMRPRYSYFSTMGTSWLFILMLNRCLFSVVYIGCFRIPGLSLYVGGNSNNPHFLIPTSISLVLLHSVILLQTFSVSVRLPVIYAASSANKAPRIGMKCVPLVQPAGTWGDGTCLSSHRSYWWKY